MALVVVVPEALDDEEEPLWQAVELVHEQEIGVVNVTRRGVSQPDHQSW